MLYSPVKGFFPSKEYFIKSASSPRQVHVKSAYPVAFPALPLYVPVVGYWLLVLYSLPGPSAFLAFGFPRWDIKVKNLARKTYYL